MVWSRRGRPGQDAAGVHRLSARQREEGDRSRCRRRLDLQSRLLGVPFGGGRAPDRRVVSRHAAGDAGRDRGQRRFRLQPDRQHRPARQDRQAQGLCRDRRHPLADAAGRADHCRGRPAGVQAHGLVRSLGAQGHAAPDHRQAQQGAWCRAWRPRYGQALRRTRLHGGAAGGARIGLLRRLRAKEVALWTKVLGGLEPSAKP